MNVNNFASITDSILIKRPDASSTYPATMLLLARCRDASRRINARRRGRPATRRKKKERDTPRTRISTKKKKKKSTFSEENSQRKLCVSVFLRQLPDSLLAISFVLCHRENGTMCSWKKMKLRLRIRETRIILLVVNFIEFTSNLYCLPKDIISKTECTTRNLFWNHFESLDTDQENMFA